MNKQKISLAHHVSKQLILTVTAAGCLFTAVPAIAGNTFGATSSIMVKAVNNAPSTLGLQNYLGCASVSSVLLENEDTDEEIYVKVDELPQFPGGNEGLAEYLKKNFHYPEEAVKKDIQGRVIVKFVVEKDGSIGETTVLQSADSLLDAEAIRLVKNMPNWKPAKVDGKDVANYLVFPSTSTSTPKA